MAIWPFRSKPVVIPFHDDFTIRTFDYPCPVSQQFSDIIIPDNIFAIPFAIMISLTMAGGVHPTTLSNIAFYRNGLLIAQSVPLLMTALNTYQICWAPHSVASTVAASPLTWVAPLLYPFHLFPRDTIQFNHASYLVTDTLLTFRVTAQVWEVY